MLPSDRTIVIERFRDEIGDWRLCILSPYGGRVHATWGLALSARIREQYGLESDAIWSDDGIIVHLPDADEPPGAELVMVEPDELEDLVVGELGGSALFGARFRENAGRALLIPRAYPGRRTPLWQQRLKSQSLLEVAKRYGQFPIVLETYRECLRDVLDVPGLQELLRALHSRELSLVEVETPTASPYASSLLFDYVATYMYEGDTPNAERRAAALALDRDLLRELLGQEELRELIDPAALEQVEADLQRLSERTRADSVDAMHDVLRRVGDLTLDEARLRAGRRRRVARAARRRAPRRPPARGRRAALDRRRGRRACTATRSARCRRPGCPEVFLEDVPNAMERLVRRFARTHGPFEAGVLKERYGLDLTPGAGRPRARRRAGARRAAARAARGASGATRRCCAGSGGPRSPRCARRSSRPTSVRSRASCRAGRASTATPPPGAGIDRLRDVLVPLQGLALPVDVWERDVLPRRTGAYSPSWLDQLCAAGEIVWVGAGSLGRRSGRVAIYFREDAALLGAPPAPPAPEGGVHDALRARLAAGACFFTDLLTDVPGVPTEELVEALWDLVWAGEATNDAWAPLRSPKLTAAAPWSQKARADRRRSFSARRRGATPTVQGRWSLTASLFAGDDPRRAAAPRPSCCSSATGSSRASRCSPRASPAASRRCTTRSWRWRRSASPAAATSSRASAARSSRCPARSSGCARSATTTRRRRSCSPRPTRRSRTAPSSSGHESKAAPLPARPAPTSCWPAPSRCSTSSAAARACRSSSPRTTRA